jgi:hypothetical protein
MLDMSAEALDTVTRSWTMRMRAESWFVAGGQATQLADEIPVSSGTEEVDAGLAVPERVTLSVPREDRGIVWAPTRPDHPLAAYGQRIKVEVGIDLGRDQVEWLQRGWFVITDSEVRGDTVAVQAAGLMYLIQEARLVSPFQPSGNFTNTLRSLIEPAVTANIEGLTDRAVPTSVVMEDDRIRNVQELLDAWPADAFVDEGGVLQVRPETVGTSVLSLTDGVGGTVIQVDGSTTRSGSFTTVVARGQKADGTPLQAVAHDTVAASPLRAGGPFNPLPVPHFFFSPLLTTLAQCRASAATILNRLRRTSSRAVTATLVPHPGLRIDDVVTITSERFNLTNRLAVIDGLRLPYNADGGPMVLELRLTS